MLTLEEFETRYCERHGINLKNYCETFKTVPCPCGEPRCKGWAARKRMKSLEVPPNPPMLTMREEADKGAKLAWLVMGVLTIIVIVVEIVKG